MISARNATQRNATATTQVREVVPAALKIVCYDDLVSGALVRLSPDTLSRGRAFYLLQAQPGGSAAAGFVAWVEAQVHACMDKAFSANAPSGR